MSGHDSDSSSEDLKPDITPLEIAEWMEIEYSVDEFFEPKELEEMAYVELKRYKSIRANYECFKAMGK